MVSNSRMRTMSISSLQYSASQGKILFEQKWILHIVETIANSNIFKHQS